MRRILIHFRLALIQNALKLNLSPLLNRAAYGFPKDGGDFATLCRIELHGGVHNRFTGCNHRRTFTSAKRKVHEGSLMWVCKGGSPI